MNSYATRRRFSLLILGCGVPTVCSKPDSAAAVRRPTDPAHGGAPLFGNGNKALTRHRKAIWGIEPTASLTQTAFRWSKAFAGVNRFLSEGNG